jgi:hypothetical protein
MNLQNIISEIEKVDPEVYERMDTRRSAMREFAKASGKIALASLPFMMGSMFKKAYGQTQTDVIATLKFALTLEYIESEFYKQAVPSIAVTTTASPAALGALTKIRDHEIAHVAYLRAVLSAMGDNTAPVLTAANFDFTAGNGTGTGPFMGVFTNYDLLLAVAQTFEDTGVRAYKGAAGTLINNNDVLTAALNVHSVEARHASHIRQMRRARAASPGGPLYSGVNPAKPWIENAESNIASAAVQPSYAGEELGVQLGVNIATNGGVTAAAATAAFDEPLDRTSVLAIVDPFII